MKSTRPDRGDGAGGGRILIVEDEPALLRALRIGLRARGYEVLTTASGREGLGRAAEQPPDAVRLDLGLLTEPGMGYRYQP